MEGRRTKESRFSALSCAHTTGVVAALGGDRPHVIVAGHRHAWMLGRVDSISIVSSDQRRVGFADGTLSLERLELVIQSP